MQTSVITWLLTIQDYAVDKALLKFDRYFWTHNIILTDRVYTSLFIVTESSKKQLDEVTEAQLRTVH